MQMNWRLAILLACIASYFFPLPLLAISASIGVPNVSASPELSTEQLKQLAKSIAVKVLAGDTWGSGILIERQGHIYTVLTNDHVLTPGYGNSFRIQTPDGRIYTARVSRRGAFNGNDLGLLLFRSAVSYRLASLAANSRISVGDRVFAAGFPVEAEGLVFTSGQISLILDRALQQGYQIGYTNNIQKGMSGGPVLNLRGEVVAINAMHAYPLWGNPYVFQDGSLPSEEMQQQMIELSWAVPVQTFLELRR